MRNAEMPNAFWVSTVLSQLWLLAAHFSERSGTCVFMGFLWLAFAVFVLVMETRQRRKERNEKR